MKDKNDFTSFTETRNLRKNMQNSSYFQPSFSILQRLGLAFAALSMLVAGQAFHRASNGSVHADTPLAQLILYEDSLQNGFSASSWNTPAPDTSYAGQVYEGSSSLQKNLFISGGSGEFMAIHRDSGINTADYTHLDFYARSISSEGAKVKVRFAESPWAGSSEKIDIDIPSGQWTHFSIAFEDFGPNILSKQYDGIAFSGGGAGAPSNDSDNNVAFDNVRLVKLTDESAPLIFSTSALGQGVVNVRFSEKINPADSSVLSTYELTSTTDANYSSAQNPSSAELLANGLEVRLTFAMQMQDGHSYTLVVSNIADLAGNVIAANSQMSFSVSVSVVTLSINAANEVYPFRDTMRGVATNNWNWLWHGLWDRQGTCCVPGKRDAIIEATSYLEPGVIRFAGGLWANNVGWDRSGSSPEDGGWTYTDPNTGQKYSYGHKYSPQMVDSFADFASQLNSEAIIQINVCDNNPKMWADLLRYTNIEKGYSFKYWELGNEQTLDPCGLDENSYAQRYADYQAALKSVDPNILMLGPVAHMPSFPDWEDALVNEVGTDVDVMTWHWYQLTEWTSNSNSFAYQGGSVEALFAHDGNVGTTCQEGFNCINGDPQSGNIDPDRLSRWTYRRGIAEAKLRQVNQYRVADPTLETAITEFGPHAVRHEDPINSNHIAALWLADVLPRHAYNGLDIVTYYSLEDGGTGGGNSRGLIGIWDNDFIDIRPIYYTEYMFAQYFGDMMVESSTSDPKQMVVAWASIDTDEPGTLKLMLVNFNDSAAEASVNISGFAPVAGDAYEMTSTNPLSLDDTRSYTDHSTMINGVKIPDFDIDNPSSFRNALAQIQPRDVTVSGSSFNYDIPAYSAVSVVLRGNGVPPPDPGPGDTVAPVISILQPSGTLSAGTTQATLSLNTNEPATCRYSTSAGIVYGSMPNTFATIAGTGHSKTVNGLQNGQSYSFYVRCQDSSGNSNNSDSNISFNVASVAPPPPTEAQAWPAKIDLSVGEAQTYTLMDGTQRTLKLLSYNIVIPRHKVEATVQVSGAGKTETHTLEVAYAGVPVSINGIRVYGYAWKEANDFGFEEVGITGDFPLTPGKSVGFAVSDALGTMFPDIDSYTYPVDIAFNEGYDVQTFLEPAGDGDETAWAHAGVDIKVPSDGNLVAITNGIVWYQLNGDPNSQGSLWISASNGEKWSDPKTWLWTHVKGDSATVPSGTFVTKGTPLAQKCSTCGGFHFGSKASFDFGAWMFAQEVWNYEHRNDFPVPRYWLILGPYSGDINVNRIYTNESGNIPSALMPEEGNSDKDGNKTWRFRDNLVNSVVNVEELLSVSPYSGNPDRKSNDSVAYAATYVFSPDNHTTDGQVWLKWGSNGNAKVWLNGNLIFTKSNSPLVVDEFDIPLPLKRGWNTIILKTDNDSDPWRFSAKIGDSNGNHIPGLEFSARDINLDITSVSDNHITAGWEDPGHTGTFVETYKLDVATDEGFNNLVINDRDIGKVTGYTINGLNSGQDYYVRVRPYSRSEFGGTTFWQHVDSIKARTEGNERLLPSTSPPGGLDPSEVPLFITLGSDDNNDKDGVYFLVDELLGGKLNPSGTGNPATYDGTPLKATFYLIGVHETYSSGLCESHLNAYENGHEIGNHAYENKGGLSTEGWRDSISRTNDYISRTTGCDGSPHGVGVPADEIYGFRAPEDNYNQALYPVLEELGFTYSASTAVGRRPEEDGTNYPWPGTLDEGFPLADWQKDPGQHPGFWSVPQSVMNIPPSLGGGATGYCDLDWFFEWGDDPDGGAAKMGETLKHNLDLHLNGNRSPLHLCLHGDAWGKKSWETERSSNVLARQDALQNFIEYALSKPQVRIVRQIDVINWMRNPVPLGVSGDETAPTAPEILSASAMSKSQIDLTWAAAVDQESGVASYNVYRDGVNVASVNATGYSDVNLEEGTNYSYQVAAVNGFGMEGSKSGFANATTFTDLVAPTIAGVSSSGSPNVVIVKFSEQVEQASATNKNNYSIDKGINISSASLKADLKTVTLNTSDHAEELTYTITVNNVRDRANIPNTIAADSQSTYTFTPVLVISELTVVNGKTYEIAESAISNGSLVFIDRNYGFSSVPASIAGQAKYIRTANDDKLLTGDNFMTFRINMGATVYVAYDSDLTPPSWMAVGFADTGEQLLINGSPHDLWSKNFQDGVVSIGANYGTNSSSNYSVIVKPSNGGVTPPNNPPSASFTANPTTGEAPIIVQFDASGSSDSDGQIVSYHWNFGDGLSGQGVNVSHEFQFAGEFTISLTITDNEGDSDTFANTIVVLDTPAPGIITLTAQITNADEGEVVQVPIELSEVPDGLAGFNFVVSMSNPEVARILSVEMPGFVVLENTVESGSSARFAAIDGNNLVVPGDASVTLAIIHIEAITDGSTNLQFQSVLMDDDNGFAIDAQKLNGIMDVSNRLPLISLPQIGEVDEGEVFNIAGSFVDPGDNSWTAFVDYGEGSGFEPFVLSGMSFALNHFYDSAGVYTIAIKIVDDNDAEAIGSLTITVTSRFPILPGMKERAKDLDGDGKAEDMNGNNRLDFADVVTFFEHITSIEIQTNISKFDFNGNGRIDMADIKTLFDILIS